VSVPNLMSRMQYLEKNSAKSKIGVSINKKYVPYEPEQEPRWSPWKTFIDSFRILGKEFQVILFIGNQLYYSQMLLT
jgi:hypothetical protein